MNLKHLRYFWAVAHAGSVAAASNKLHLTPQTVSAQIKLLEDDLGTALFKPAGRGLELTEAGRVALSYADEIFALGHEMVSSLRANAIPEQTMATFRVGISDAIPKSLTHRLLASLKRVEKPIRLVCHEGTIDWLLGNWHCTGWRWCWPIARCRQGWRSAATAASWVKVPSPFCRARAGAARRGFSSLSERGATAAARSERGGTGRDRPLAGRVTPVPTGHRGVR